jgi:hypothetical protein
VAVGTVGALLGIGGGLLIIPFFLFVFHFSPQQTVGTATVIVFLNAISGTVAYLQDRKIYLKAAVWFGIATIPGAFAGSYLASFFTGKSFSLLFGCFLLVMAGMLYWQSCRRVADVEFNPDTFQCPMKLGVVCSVGVGVMASALGIGGGIIHVPFMAYVLKFPIHVAIATSTVILAISAISGAISHAILGHVLWIPAIFSGIGAIIGAQLGAKIAGKSKPQILTKGLSVLVFVMAVKFIMNGL